ncbi:MAG: sugar phosphate isomerase/epimerase [Sedimentisphaerales bacterium]|jgi:sugar phosphate isomerase/epimerase|nr:sugar phosphate isomerase/epimerase [Sedimentisphaerales bacterium]
MAKLSAFADEVSADFCEQVQFLSKEGLHYIEPRFINKKNIMDLTKGQLKESKKIIQDAGLAVSAIGSPIGKVRLDEPFPPHLDKFKHTIELAQLFETPYIRVFSYYAPKERNINDFRKQVMERMSAKVMVIENTNIVMVHENETDIYGHSAKNCVDLVETINSPRLRLVYDPGNLVWGQKITNNVEVCWPLMKPYVVHVHIKDWKIGSKDVGSIPGEGDGQIKELLAELAKLKYDGCLTMEPHLKAGGQFGGDTGPELFSRAIAAVRKLSDEVGLKCE